jgi:hypothetical protein
MAKRANWDFIEPLWRAAKLSNLEICRRYDALHKNSTEWKHSVTEAAIRKEAKLKNWKKDLVDEVRNAVKEKLVRQQVRTDKIRTDKEIVDAASGALALVVESIRSDVMKTRVVLERLRQEIIDDPDQVKLFAYQGAVTEHLVKMGTPDHSAAVRNLTTAERQWLESIWKAYGLDEPDEVEKKDLQYNFYFGGDEGNENANG